MSCGEQAAVGLAVGEAVVSWMGQGRPVVPMTEMGEHGYSSSLAAASEAYGTASAATRDEL